MHHSVCTICSSTTYIYVQGDSIDPDDDAFQTAYDADTTHTYTKYTKDTKAHLNTHIYKLLCARLALCVHTAQLGAHRFYSVVDY